MYTASFIHTPDIKRTPVIWLAFSQDAWTKKVFDRYRKADLRQQRMTKLDLTAFKAAPTKQPHASSWSLTICEYCHAEDRVEPGRAQGVERQRFYSASCRSRALARARWPN